MNYRVSLSEMDKMAAQANLKKSTISLEEMKKQALNLRDNSVSKVKKKYISKILSVLHELHRLAFSRLPHLKSQIATSKYSTPR